MPAYDYRCRDCDTRTEVRRGLSDPETAVACRSCSGATTRVWTAVAVGGGTSGAAPAPATSAPAGGCCGGGCCG